MRRRVKIAITGTAVLGLAAMAAVGIARADGPGWGGGHGGPGRMGVMMLFDRFDTNGDGRVTREELAATRADQMTRFDASRDGALTLEEFTGLWQEFTREMMVRAFQMHDRDGDGRVTAEELARPTERMLGWLDRDGDGAVARDELRGRDGRGSRGDGRGPGGPPR
jgi:hypothetical protein